MGIRVLALLAAALPLSFAQDNFELASASGDNCTFKADPDAYLQREARAKSAIYQRMASFSKQKTSKQNKNSENKINS